MHTSTLKSKERVGEWTDKLMIPASCLPTYLLSGHLERGYRSEFACRRAKAHDAFFLLELGTGNEPGTKVKKGGRGVGECDKAKQYQLAIYLATRP